MPGPAGQKPLHPLVVQKLLHGPLPMPGAATSMTVRDVLIIPQSILHVRTARVCGFETIDRVLGLSLWEVQYRSPQTPLDPDPSRQDTALDPIHQLRSNLVCSSRRPELFFACNFSCVSPNPRHGDVPHGCGLAGSQHEGHSCVAHRHINRIMCGQRPTQHQHTR